MTVIRQEDFIASVAGALQYISYYHPVDYITAWPKPTSANSPLPPATPWRRSSSTAACAPKATAPSARTPASSTSSSKSAWTSTSRPLQAKSRSDLQEMSDEGVRRAYLDPDNKLRASLQADPAGARKNTKDNTPACVSVELVQGSTVEVTVAAKGGGSEAKSKFAMLNPSDSVVEWVLKTVPTMGAGWCPPGMLGIGIGGTAEKAMLLAKTALMDPIDIQDLIARGPKTDSRKTPRRTL